MSTLRVTNLKGGTSGSSPNFPDGAVITGVATVGVLSATTFYGSGANLTGIDATALKDSGGTVKIQANSDGAVVTGVLTAPTVSGTTGSFNGNVSVGGTLTYEDVTNVDSVGLITARNGVNISGSDLKVGAAFTVGQAGVVTATSFVGDGANLTNLPPGGNTFTGIASASNANNNCVMVCHDGKLSEIKAPLGTIDPFTNNGGQTQMGGFHNGTHFDICWDPANEGVWVAYPVGNASNRLDVSFYKLQAYVNSRPDWIHSNSYVEVTVDSTSNCESPKLVYDPDTQRTIICWRKGGTEAFNAKVLQYNSNNTITQGSIVALLSSGCLQPDAIYDTTNNKVILGCVDTGPNRYETWVCTITGGSTNSLSAGTATNNAGVTGTTENRFPTMVWDPDNEKVVLYTRCNGGSYSTTGVICVGTYSSGTGTLVWDTATQIGDNQYAGTIVYDTNRNKFVVLYANGSDSYNRYTRVVTVSGTTVTVAANEQQVTALGRNTSDNENHAMTFDPLSNKVVFYFYDEDDSKLYFNSGIINAGATGMTMGTHVTITGAQYRQNGFPGMSGTYTKNGQHLFVAKNSSDSNQVYVKNVRTASNVNNLSNYVQYVGFADQAYTDGQTATIKTYGNNVSTLSGLSPATMYYVQADGTVATTADVTLWSSPANTPVAGTALNATTLLIRDPRISPNSY